MSSKDQNCVFKELVRSFAMEYFNGKLRWYYEKIQSRISRYSVLKCNSIDTLTDEELAELFWDLWSLNYLGQDEEARKRHIREYAHSIRTILKKLLCEERILDKDFFEIMKEIRSKGFKLRSLTEIASLLHPDRFFLLNDRVMKALKYLSEKGILPGDEYVKQIDKKILDLIDSYIEGKKITNEKELVIKEFYRVLREVLDQTLKHLREVNDKANYGDVDAFKFFISIAYDLEARSRISPDITKNYIKKVESSFGKGPKEVFDDWLNQAIVKCTKKQIKPMDVGPCQELDEKEEKIIRTIADLLVSKKQIVVYGVPGTGKTFLAKCAAIKIAGSEGRVRFVTFHPSYSYEDFVEGIRPTLDKASGGLEFKIEDGIFKKIVAMASYDFISDLIKELEEQINISELGEYIVESVDEIISRTVGIRDKLRELHVPKERLKEIINKAPKHVLVIDEINRGDMARIFGELITLLENDKRLFEDNEIIAWLPYSKKPFYVPPNLYIIGTMNSTDRSIAFVDYALRRRFAFVELDPDPSKVPETVEGFKLREFFNALNEYLAREIDRDHRIGHSYFMNIDSLEKLRSVWFSQIRPLLMEFFYGRDVEIKDMLSRLYTEPFIDDLKEFEKELNFAMENLRKSM